MWAIVAAFLAVQVCIIWFAANGPFVDEGLYTVAGMRVLEGKGLSSPARSSSPSAVIPCARRQGGTVNHSRRADRTGEDTA